jgi:hypothetical protein
MYLRGHESRLFILDPSSRPGTPDFTPGVPAREAEPTLRSQIPAGGWSWDRYAAELNIPAGRIDVGRRLVAAISTAIRELDLPWQVVMRKGYVAIQRSGGYNALVVDLWWNHAPRLAGKIPAEPKILGLTSPFPNLDEVWTASEREWGWTVPPGTPLPDVGALIDLILPFQPAHGPMPAHAASIPAVGDHQPQLNMPQATVISSEVHDAIQRLASSGASSNAREAAEGLLAMGYQLRLPKTTVPDRRRENYLRIMDPAYTAHGVGYLTPTMFSFSRMTDRDRLADLPDAAMTAGYVNFLHTQSAKPGLAAARLLMNKQESA